MKEVPAYKKHGFTFVGPHKVHKKQLRNYTFALSKRKAKGKHVIRRGYRKNGIAVVWASNPRNDRIANLRAFEQRY